MNKHTIFYTLLALIVIAFAVLFFQRNTQLQSVNEDLAAQKKKQAEWDAKLEDMVNTNAELRDIARKEAAAEMKAREEALEMARAADEARRMAEAKAKKEAEERQKILAQLLEKLEKEAAIRQEAENSLNTLQDRIQQLTAAQSEADAKLKELETAKAEYGEGVEGASVADLTQAEEELKRKEEELQRLAREKEEMEARYQVALDNQNATLSEIKDKSERYELYPPFKNIVNAVLVLFGFRE